MIEFILIIIISGSSGRAIEEVGPFVNRKECQEAGFEVQKIQKLFLDVNYVCVERTKGDK